MAKASYKDLLLETMPQVIQSERRYDQTRRRFGDLLGNNSRTANETKLMKLLGLLIQDYDRRHAMPPDDSTPDEILRFLMEHSGKKPADLLPIFGQRSRVNDALNGRRKITAEQAGGLGSMFHVKPSLFA